MKDCLVTEVNVNNLCATCSILIGNFNAKCSEWCASDKNNAAGLELDNIMTTSGYSQMINEPTHLDYQPTSMDHHHAMTYLFLSCKNCGVKQSLYEKCHNIIYGTLNFSTLLYPPYYREVLNFKNAKTECIQKAISNFD